MKNEFLYGVSFLTLLEVEGWADTQSAHCFIDDPVSSLDDHNIYVTAYTVFDLIERKFKNRKTLSLPIILVFLTILSDMLGKVQMLTSLEIETNPRNTKSLFLRVIVKICH